MHNSSKLFSLASFTAVYTLIRTAIKRRIDSGKKDILCTDCEKRVSLIDQIEKKFASEKWLKAVREMDEQAKRRLDNESLMLILEGQARAIAGEAGQIYRDTSYPDWGIDAEIEFKNNKGEASGKRVYLQLKSGDSYLYKRNGDEKEQNKSYLKANLLQP